MEEEVEQEIIEEEGTQLSVADNQVKVTNEMGMSKNRSRTFTFVVISLLSLIVVLLVCNLSATTYLIFKFQQSPNLASAGETEPLPASLGSSQAKDQLLQDFQELYNAQDSAGLYSLLDPLAQIDIPKEKFNQQINDIYQLTGKIENGTYSQYKYLGVSNGRKWFSLEYKIRTEKGSASLVINITQQDGESYHIVGFNLNQR